MFRPASSGSVHSLARASCAVFAWIEHIPGMPLFSAISRSSDSASRTSPTTSRSGRIRSASLTSRRREISPVPSRLGWRHCIATVSPARRSSSKISSTVTIRSLRSGCRQQRPEQRRLAALGGAGDEDVLPRQHAGPQEFGGGRGERADVDEVLQLLDALGEFADVHRPVLLGHVGDDHVKPRTVRQRRIHERARDVDAPAGGLQHPLHQVAHLACRSARTVVRCASPCRATNTSVGALIQISSTSGSSKNGCSGTEADDAGHNVPGRLGLVCEHRHRPTEGVLAVPLHLVVHVPVRQVAVPAEIDAVQAHPLPHPVGDDGDGSAHRAIIRQNG